MRQTRVRAEVAPSREHSRTISKSKKAAAATSHTINTKTPQNPIHKWLRRANLHIISILLFSLQCRIAAFRLICFQTVFSITYSEQKCPPSL